MQIIPSNSLSICHLQVLHACRMTSLYSITRYSCLRRQHKLGIYYLKKTIHFRTSSLYIDKGMHVLAKIYNKENLFNTISLLFLSLCPIRRCLAWRKTFPENVSGKFLLISEALKWVNPLISHSSIVLISNLLTLLFIFPLSVISLDELFGSLPRYLKKTWEKHFWYYQCIYLCSE